MLIKQVFIENADQAQDVRVVDGKFVAIANHLEAVADEQVIDAAGKLMVPPFVDPHVHLDSTMTAGDPEWNETGTLFDGIRIWSDRKETLSHEDVKQRAIQALRIQAAHGLQFVRSHVDVTDPNLTALKALLEVREEVKPWMTLQLVAFPQEGILSFPGGKELMIKAAEMGVDAIGAIPHFEFTREYSVESLHFAFEVAQKYGLLVDAHTDEIDDPASRGLETMATLALETGLKEKVTASHTTAMGSYNDAYVYKLMRLLKMADINFVSNPLINMYLGGRFDTYPKRRGLTRVKELDAEGINVAFGEDDIKDPWYPMGNGNMMDVLHMGLHATQIMGYTEIMNSYRFITKNGARTMQVQDSYGIEVGKPANFLIFNAKNWYDALNERAELLYSVHNGNVLVETKPAEVTVTLPE
ncbi:MULTISPECIES: cytosine deaminase [Weissella]|uniref:Cytosine deaminase n=1 Tax=Weissella cibaria TaxID=137591 RepID=A0A2S1KPQ4_9LACO|nr:cytosine deaminase [Weissella cibaria]AWF94981.1 Cytosine deaminase [Weissella cibaria]MBU7544431.1 cytosine deaminase [Weissella cibaria]MBZ5942402.1 cytosine deaminase [Weissella cibaria]MCB5826641.1 cytosine deaminase [Weissella cibaria]MCB5858222.1 cytosine deaminase [Weissella cibaria]